MYQYYHFEVVMRAVISLLASGSLFHKFVIQCLVTVFKGQKISTTKEFLSGKDLKAFTHRTFSAAGKPLADVVKWLKYLSAKVDFNVGVLL
jgi:hypothetical protein